MNIGFDLDKVFIDFPPLVPDSIINRLYKKKANGTLSYRIPSRPEQIVRHVSHHPLLRPPIKENLAFLESIRTQGHKLYLISSRFDFLQTRTERLVKKYHFDQLFDGLYFNYENKQPHLFKNEVIQKLQIAMYVDDDFQLLKYVAKHNKHTKFFWLNYKKKRQMLTRNIDRIGHLSEIFAP